MDSVKPQLPNIRLSQFITDGLDVFHDEKDHTYQRDCPYLTIYIPMTPVGVMMAKMVIAHLSAMNYLLRYQ